MNKIATLTEAASAARKEGMTYGRWVAKHEPPTPKPSKRSKRKPPEHIPTRHEKEIREMFDAGMMGKEIAAKLGMTQQALSREMRQIGISYVRRNPWPECKEIGNDYCNYGERKEADHE